ncbi:uncharacterized protein LOC106637507 isoform X2 [Copidosoma floridanum]|uniref:uncharacterized protein LOC106637507 isoform X2 n=1 Tax=Copidosoma floridanum TaxID=29053 RepID=UPI0006C94AFB|nr:uncharacterized protein LOC106637507 isoform X2 [Copidosoma floridanum]
MMSMMRKFSLVGLLCLGVLCIAEAVNVVDPYLEDKLEEAALLQQAIAEEEAEYPDNVIDNLFRQPDKRACVRRGGICDHRPHDCCFNSSCRCNLWGSNCRCQRVGLFQKWGKK